MRIGIQDFTKNASNSVKTYCGFSSKIAQTQESNRFLASKDIPVAPQPPYSPDLSPCDFFLFPKLKNHPKGHHFGTLENIQTAATDHLKAIPISEFHQCYEEWKKRLQRCVASEGSYFEGGNVELYKLGNNAIMTARNKNQAFGENYVNDQKVVMYLPLEVHPSKYQREQEVFCFIQTLSLYSCTIPTINFVKLKDVAKCRNMLPVVKTVSAHVQGRSSRVVKLSDRG
ncbi:putative transposase [Trichonephila clavipes]|nr:putative transposase [Trichonephila clavipes]